MRENGQLSELRVGRNVRVTVPWGRKLDDIGSWLNVVNTNWWAGVRYYAQKFGSSVPGEVRDMYRNLLRHKAFVEGYSAWRAKGSNTDTVAGLVTYIESVGKQHHGLDLPPDAIAKMRFKVSGRWFTVGQMRANPELALKYLDMEVGVTQLRQMIGTDAIAKAFFKAMLDLNKNPPKDAKMGVRIPGYRPDQPQQDQGAQQPQQVNEGLVISISFLLQVIAAVILKLGAKLGMKLFMSAKGALIGEDASLDVAAAASIVVRAIGDDPRMLSKFREFVAEFVGLVKELGTAPGETPPASRVKQLLLKHPEVAKVIIDATRARH